MLPNRDTLRPHFGRDFMRRLMRCALALGHHGDCYAVGNEWPIQLRREW